MRIRVKTADGTVIESDSAPTSIAGIEDLTNHLFNSMSNPRTMKIRSGYRLFLIPPDVIKTSIITVITEVGDYHHGEMSDGLS